MSNTDIKMSDVFDLPISSLMRDSLGNDLDNPDIDEGKAIAHAINSHDALVEQNKALIEALKHIKKHQETVVVGMPQLSATWQIAARALEQTKTK